MIHQASISGMQEIQAVLDSHQGIRCKGIPMSWQIKVLWEHLIGFPLHAVKSISIHMWLQSFLVHIDIYLRNHYWVHKKEDYIQQGDRWVEKFMQNLVAVLYSFHTEQLSEFLQSKSFFALYPVFQETFICCRSTLVFNNYKLAPSKASS